MVHWSLLIISTPVSFGVGLLVNRFHGRLTKKASNSDIQASDGIVSNFKKARYVLTPHPDWKPGQKQPHPFASDEMLGFDPAKIDKGTFYSLMISAVTPRPVAFVSTVDAKGSVNLAPYSYFNILSNNPPVLAFGATYRTPVNGGLPKKDTLANVEETGEFVINIISEWFVEAANFTAIEADRGFNELEAAGLTPVPSVHVKAPRVKESVIQFECKLKQIIPLNDSTTGQPSASIVLGEIVLVHIHKEATELSPTGKVVVDPLKVKPVCRFGGVSYGRVSELYEIPRPNRDGSFSSFTPKAVSKAHS
ncbi:hypothetical protein CEUSTIGMA_g4915.t1 [Chlamydomonas eustigma]|uniref:Flavin reductase like domain-containing protein n=1 Tax=Chlamydomonas eustigma TaxID=1157962 RepID=A0A250X332_9CHLO|nr:hypothetical protein CEUSTIGMA_g4915.t1 [Chlamydomonas eustigma]|eukprot:GAX77471.1 hypothetical protein CEUSTIGMA_g4915.t1 [Chlamydomonas eustigma]